MYFCTFGCHLRRSLSTSQGRRVLFAVGLLNAPQHWLHVVLSPSVAFCPFSSLDTRKSKSFHSLGASTVSQTLPLGSPSTLERHLRSTTRSAKGMIGGTGRWWLWFQISNVQHQDTFVIVIPQVYDTREHQILASGLLSGNLRYCNSKCRFIP